MKRELTPEETRTKTFLARQKKRVWEDHVRVMVQADEHERYRNIPDYLDQYKERMGISTVHIEKPFSLKCLL